MIACCNICDHVGGMWVLLFFLGCLDIVSGVVRNRGFLYFCISMEMLFGFDSSLIIFNIILLNTLLVWQIYMIFLCYWFFVCWRVSILNSHSLTRLTMIMRIALFFQSLLFIQTMTTIFTRIGVVMLGVQHLPAQISASIYIFILLNAILLSQFRLTLVLKPEIR